MGLIGTMSALVLGLMVGSAKSSFDAQKAGLTQMSAKIIVLDRALAHYGAETKEARELLRAGVTRILEQVWPEGGSAPQIAPSAAGEVVYDKIQQLTPKSDAQRSVQNQALSIAVDIAQARWLLFQQAETAISTPFLVVLVFWLTVIFMSFGLFAPVNATAVITLLLCSLSVSGAVFLILELDRPFEGMLQIPSTVLRNALAQLGR
ncbi:MAG: hypothetical protein U0793_05880 [Gemmataceae bacterium]